MHPESADDRRLALAETFLFVPGDRPERFAKAVASGADVIVIDLEDAVAAESKHAARAATASWFQAGGQSVVRINAGDTKWFRDDLAMCAAEGVSAVMLPKAQANDNLREVARSARILALIESAKGVADMVEIVKSPNVLRLSVGALDLALDLAITAGESALDPIRLQMVVLSRCHGLSAPIDGVTLNFEDAEMVFNDANRSRQMGFGGKLCIHPRQVQQVSRAFKPSPMEIERATRIIAASRSSGTTAAISVGAEMVDKPVLQRAHQLLAKAGLSSVKTALPDSCDQFFS